MEHLDVVVVVHPKDVRDLLVFLHVGRPEHPEKEAAMNAARFSLFLNSLPGLREG